MVVKWVHVASSSRPDKFYWRSADGQHSQWQRPQAGELIDDLAPIFSDYLTALPFAVVQRELLPWFDVKSLGRFCAVSRGGYALAAANDVWAPHLCTAQKGIIGTALRVFASTPRERKGLSATRVDQIGREFYRSERAPYLLETHRIAFRNARAPASLVDLVARDPFLEQCIREGVFTPTELFQGLERIAKDLASTKSDKVLHGDRLSEWIHSLQDSTKPVTSIFTDLIRYDTTLRDVVKYRCPRLLESKTRSAINKLHDRKHVYGVDLQIVLEHRPTDLFFAAQHASAFQHLRRSQTGADAQRMFRLTFGLSRDLRAAITEKAIDLRHLIAMGERARRDFENEFKQRKRVEKLDKARFSRFRTGPAVLHGEAAERSHWA